MPEPIMLLLAKIWEFITNIVPVERWVRSIGNVLKLLSLAFILVSLLITGLILQGWGFSPLQRFDLIKGLMVMMGLVLLLAVLLAMLPGGLLYNPYERSLNRGRRYGTDNKPRRRLELEKEPKQTSEPTLSAPPSKALPERTGEP